MSGRRFWRREAGRRWSRTEATSTGSSEPQLPPTVSRCIHQQLREALDLAVSSRVLSDAARIAGDPLTAVALDRLSTDLKDQAAMLAPLVPPDLDLADPPLPDPSSSGPPTSIAELDHRLSRAALVAQTDSMTPGLGTMVAGLLWALATLYQTRRELLLVCTLLDSA
jgi:hypothetical protein